MAVSVENVLDTALGVRKIAYKITSKKVSGDKIKLELEMPGRKDGNVHQKLTIKATELSGNSVSGSSPVVRKVLTELGLR